MPRYLFTKPFLTRFYPRTRRQPQAMSITILATWNTFLLAPASRLNWTELLRRTENWLPAVTVRH